MFELILSLIFLNFIIYLKIDKISVLINLYDRPDNKLKKHKSSTPLLGGLIFFLNLFLIIFFNYLLDLKIIILQIKFQNYFVIIFLIISFFLMGLIDDKYKLKPEKKILFSIIFLIISLILNNDLLLTDLNFSFYKKIFLNNFNFFFTIFCIIILVNAINFYDGINGQSIILFLISFIFLAYKSPNFIFYLIICSLLIFILFLNLSNKIFMGDNGIYLLSILLSICLIYEYKEFKSILYVDEIFFLLILPGYDLLRLTLTRIAKGKNPLYGDRNHIHHLLNDKFSLLKSNIILLLLIILPIFLFTFLRFNFFIVLLLITFIYVFVILKLSINNENNYIRKKK